MNRRQALQTLLAGALQAAGAVVLASSSLQAAQEPAPSETDPEKRADQLATEDELPEGESFVFYQGFRRGGFRRGGGGGGFANGGFRNGGGGGGFRRGGFANGGGGGFRRGGFANGGFRNGW
jgi:hypothetical protein